MELIARRGMMGDKDRTYFAVTASLPFLMCYVWERRISNRKEGGFYYLRMFCS